MLAACFVNDVFGNMPISVLLHIVYSCFHATMAELGACDRDSETKIFTIWPSSEDVAVSCSGEKACDGSLESADLFFSLGFKSACF